MGAAGNRARRLGEQMRRELAEVIGRELKDPRLGVVTISGVELSPDLAHATVFFTVLGDAGQAELTGKVLSGAAGFLRTELSHRLRTPGTPRLRFKHDASVERGLELSRLIDRAVADSAGDEAPETPSGPASSS